MTPADIPETYNPPTTLLNLKQRVSLHMFGSAVRALPEPCHTTTTTTKTPLPVVGPPSPTNLRPALAYTPDLRAVPRISTAQATPTLTRRPRPTHPRPPPFPQRLPTYTPLLPTTPSRIPVAPHTSSPTPRLPPQRRHRQQADSPRPPDLRTYAANTPLRPTYASPPGYALPALRLLPMRHSAPHERFSPRPAFCAAQRTRAPLPMPSALDLPAVPFTRLPHATSRRHRAARTYVTPPPTRPSRPARRPLPAYVAAQAAPRSAFTPDLHAARPERVALRPCRLRPTYVAPLPTPPRCLRARAHLHAACPERGTPRRPRLRRPTYVAPLPTPPAAYAPEPTYTPLARNAAPRGAPRLRRPTYVAPRPTRRSPPTPPSLAPPTRRLRPRRPTLNHPTYATPPPLPLHAARADHRLHPTYATAPTAPSPYLRTYTTSPLSLRLTHAPPPLPRPASPWFSAVLLPASTARPPHIHDVATPPASPSPRTTLLRIRHAPEPTRETETRCRLSPPHRTPPLQSTPTPTCAPRTSPSTVFALPASPPPRWKARAAHLHRSPPNPAAETPFALHRHVRQRVGSAVALVAGAAPRSWKVYAWTGKTLKVQQLRSACSLAAPKTTALFVDALPRSP
ncbi:hypothetical protein B0H12DRAFT_1244060 [Mycena haematopus]|nr:hypothetical protein B0H12DRAFT_1244060 [Mycena haematopus]